MKKVIVFIFMAIICYLALAPTGSEGIAISAPFDVQSKGVLESTEGPGVTDSVSKSVTVKRCEYKYLNAEDKTSVKIYYPQIEGIDDNNMQTQINTLLKEDGLNEYTNNWDMVNLTLEIDYNIVYINEKYISVKFNGWGATDSYPTSLGYATNIDLSTGNRISLQDLVDINGFINIVSSGKGRMEVEDDYILDEYSYQELADRYKKQETGSVYNTFFLTENGLGIYIYVPHVVGDYRTIEVDFKDIQSNIRSKDKFWESINMGELVSH